MNSRKYPINQTVLTRWFGDKSMIQVCRSSNGHWSVTSNGGYASVVMARTIAHLESEAEWRGLADVLSKALPPPGVIDVPWDL